jgi:hypothetical protein
MQRLTLTARSLETGGQFRAAGAVYAVAEKRMKAGWMALRGLVRPETVRVMRVRDRELR